MEERLRKLATETAGLLRRTEVRPKTRILWAPGFNILPVFWVHDGLLAMALRLRGAEVIPLMCDGVQPQECAVYGGAWVSGEAQNGDIRRMHCYKCRMADHSMWDHVWGLSPVRLSAYLTSQDTRAIQQIVGGIDAKAWPSFEYDGLPVGRWAVGSVLNNNLTGYLEDIPLDFESGRNYIYDALALRIAYGRILDRYRPDRVVSHDNVYYMWDVLCRLAERRSLPYFTHWPAAVPGTWTYKRNAPAALWTVDEAWPAWRHRELSARQEAKLDKYMAARRNGQGMVYSPIPQSGDVSEEMGQLIASGFDPAKPTALLAANVVWDASALNRDPLFETMFQWVHETMGYFASRPDLQLIVKPHPGEVEPSMPPTRHKVLEEIEKAGVQVPPNVFLLPPRTAISAYDLFPYVRAGLLYTSSLGPELAMAGIPVIVAAKAPYRDKGFTVDPPTRQAYFEAIDRALTAVEPQAVIEERVRQSRAYAFLHYFHNFIDHNLCSWEWEQQPVVRVQSAEELLPGANKHLDYVCDSIINDLPILSEERWPPES